MPEDTNVWTINANVFQLPGGFGHLFLDVSNNGVLVEQFHGLATDRDTNVPTPTGGPGDQLKSWTYTTQYFSSASSQTIFTGTEAQVQKAISYLNVYGEYVNGLNIHYNLEALTGYNSNSVFAGAIDILNNYLSLNIVNLNSVVSYLDTPGYGNSVLGTSSGGYDSFEVIENSSGQITGIKVTDHGDPRTNSLLTNDMLGIQSGDDVLIGLNGNDKFIPAWQVSGVDGADTIYGGAETNKVLFDLSDGKDSYTYRTDSLIRESISYSDRWEIITPSTGDESDTDTLYSVEIVAVGNWNPENKGDFHNLNTGLQFKDETATQIATLESSLDLSVTSAADVTFGGNASTVVNMGSFIGTDYDDIFALNILLGRNFDGGNGVNAIDYSDYQILDVGTTSRSSGEEQTTESEPIAGLIFNLPEGTVGTSDASVPKDSITNFQNFVGSNYDDQFLLASLDENVINGKGGNDSVSYYAMPVLMSINVTQDQDGGLLVAELFQQTDKTDHLENIEQITGTVGDDTFNLFAPLGLTVDGAGSYGNDGVSYNQNNAASGLIFDMLASNGEIKVSQAGAALDSPVDILQNMNWVSGTTSNDVFYTGSHDAIIIDTGGDDEYHVGTGQIQIVGLGGDNPSTPGGSGTLYLDELAGNIRLEEGHYSSSVSGGGSGYFTNLDHIILGAGDDTLVGINYLLGEMGYPYLSIDMGAGNNTALLRADTLVYAGYAITDIGQEIHNVQTYGGDADYYVMEMGHHFQGGTIIYANSTTSLEINQTSTNSTVSDGVMTDTMSASSTHINIVGSNMGDQVTLSGNGFFEGGLGDDTINIVGLSSEIRYTGGNDIIHNAAGLGNLVFGPQINMSDVSFEEINKVGDDSGQAYSNYTFDLQIEIADYGSVLLTGLHKHIVSGTTYVNETPSFVYLQDTTEGTQGADNVAGIQYGYAGDDILYAVGNLYAAFGGAGNDIIHAETTTTESGFANIYDGGAGDDIIYGTNFSYDTLHGGFGDDVLYGNDGNDYLAGEAGNDVLYGGDGNDTMYGGAGNDILDGGAGDNILVGGTGNDTFIIRAGGGEDKIVDSGGNNTLKIEGNVDPTQFIYSRVGDDLHIDIGSGVTIAGYYLRPDTISQVNFDNGASYSVADLINGLYVPPQTNVAPTAKNDDFSGTEDVSVNGNVLSDNGHGPDSDLDGDTLTVIPATLTTDHAGTVTILANGDFSYTPLGNYNGVDSFIYTLTDGHGGSSIGTVEITLAAVNDVPVLKDDDFSVSGFSTLNGNVFSDNGHGIDSDVDGDTLTVNASSFSTTKGGAVILSANGAFVYTPYAGYLGNDGFNYTVSDGHGGTSAAHVSLVVSAPAGAIIGTSGNNTLTGTSGVDYIYGLAGDDTIASGGGADTFIGGTGNDTYSVNNSGIVIIENANEGSEIIYTSVSYTMPENIEYLRMTGTNNINVTGNAGATTIWGNSGNNTIAAGGGDDILYTEGGNDILYGDGGNDTLYDGTGVDALFGGTGNDTYFVIDSSTVITEYSGEGADVVSSSASYILPSYVEDLWLTGSGNINGTGNGLNNYLVGNAGSNILTGYGGDDTLIGGLNDTLIGGTGNDLYRINNGGAAIVEDSASGYDSVVTTASYALADNLEDLYLDSGNINGTGNASNNSIFGSTGNNIINGGGGNDLISASAGDDTIIGGAGNNTLTGGSGADTFKFIDGSAHDTVTDFSASAGDRLDISQLLFGYDPISDAISDFVKITESSGSSTLYVNANGTGITGDYVALATLTGATGLTDIAADITNHNLIVS